MVDLAYKTLCNWSLFAQSEIMYEIQSFSQVAYFDLIASWFARDCFVVFDNDPAVAIRQGVSFNPVGVIQFVDFRLSMPLQKKLRI